MQWKKKYRNRSHRDNYLRAVEFRNPEWIPCSISIFDAVWKKYRQDLLDLTREHPFVFGKVLRRNFDTIPKIYQPNTYFRDNWDCLWYSAQGGYEGQVVEHPLDSWDKFDTYKFPDPLRYTERGKRPPKEFFFAKIGFKLAKHADLLTSGSGERLFDRLYFLRGFD